MKNPLFAILAILAIFGSSNHLCFAQSNSSQTTKAQKNLEKIKKKVEKIGVGEKITVVKLNGQDFYGSVSSIEADDFQIVDVDTKQIHQFKYSEVKKIHPGDGERNLITGKRNNPRRGWLYGAAILGGILILTVIGLSDKDF